MRSARANCGKPAGGPHAIPDDELIAIGSSRRGAIGRVLPGSTGEKLLHGAPCAIAVVPRGYAAQPVRKIGVAYDGSPEAKAALDSAVNLARAFGDAELELVGVAASDWYTGPVLAGGIGIDVLREEIEQQVAESLAAAAASLPVIATTVLRSGDPEAKSESRERPEPGGSAGRARCSPSTPDDRLGRRP